MESKKNYIKHHIFIAIITLAILIGLIVLTIHFFKTNEMNFGFVVGFILFYLWGLTILPAGYYYFRAVANSYYQRQPKFIFFSRYQFDFYFILIAPILIPNYIWLFYMDIKNYKRNKDWEA